MSIFLFKQWTHKRHPIPRPCGRAMGASFLSSLERRYREISRVHYIYLNVCLPAWVQESVTKRATRCKHFMMSSACCLVRAADSRTMDKNSATGLSREPYTLNPRPRAKLTELCQDTNVYIFFLAFLYTTVSPRCYNGFSVLRISQDFVILSLQKM